MDPVIVDAPAPEPRPAHPNYEPEPDVANEREGGWIFLRALGSAGRRVGVWGVCWLVLTLLSLAVALPWFSAMDGMLGNRYEHGSFMDGFYRSFTAATEGGLADTTFVTDHGDELRALKSSSARVGAVAGLLVMLWYVFQAGGWLQIALGKKRSKYVKRFFFGGARYFGRFFRLYLLVLIKLSVLGWILYGMPWNELVLGKWYGVPESDWGALETLSSEDQVVHLAWMQAGLYALGFVGVMVWARYTRTRIALHDTSSVIWNGILTAFTILRHPIQTLRPMVLLLGIEVLVVYFGAMGVQEIATTRDGAPDFTMTLVAVLVGQALVAFRVVIHAARTFAAVRASQAVVRPLMRPDPWKGSVGGPGGPRYPIEDGDDEYAISV